MIILICRPPTLVYEAETQEAVEEIRTLTTRDTLHGELLPLLSSLLPNTTQYYW